MKKVKPWLNKVLRKQSIRTTIAVTFSTVSVLCLIFLATILYIFFSTRMQENTTDATERLLNQTSINLETYLRNMRLISDTMYYSVIKESDFTEDSMEEKMNLLYEANKDNLINIACYFEDGDLFASVPLNMKRTKTDVISQEWFESALGEMENFHFSTPHVQNLIDTTSSRYYWVVSLSRAVELNRNGRSTLGVLLIDMNYSSIKELFDRVNESRPSGYVYLADSEGEIIYHPRQNLIYSELLEENNLVHATYKDGTTREKFNGEDHLISIKTVSYTGWKIVCVMPYSTSVFGTSKTQYYMVMMACAIMLLMVFMSQIISILVTKPIQNLTQSIRFTDDGVLNPDIYIGGNSDIEYLGSTLRGVVAQLRKLMDDLVTEQEEKRRTELDALQSQINPHFLYNTLDSIVWMIEGEQYEDAVFMITQLASLFRISLSKGKNVISIEDELKHAQHYMNIQKVRYKDKFEVNFDVDPMIYQYCIVKLVLQPILENAIYYGVDSLDGEGIITVKGRIKDGDVYISVSDNGLGMSKDDVDRLLTGEIVREKKHGSGVGLINVHKRIQLHFGMEYGLIIESVPDVGTTVSVHVPALISEGGGQNAK